MKFVDNIQCYIPFNHQERDDKELYLQYLHSYDDIFKRENCNAHFTATAFILNHDRTKFVAVHHNIFNCWMYPGGHADGDENLLRVAMREAEEETGLKTTPISENIFAIQSIDVGEHVRHGKTVAQHKHLDAIYILEADDTVPLEYIEDESSAVKWITFKDAEEQGIGDSVFKSAHAKVLMKMKATGIWNA